MNTAASPKKLALIAGPTASGKSALAVGLGQSLPSMVINADSAQCYRDLRILSARPDEAEMAGVPHRLFGHVDGATAYSAAAWAADASAAITEARVQGRLPILVGGSGLYLRTLLDGIAPVPSIDPAIRAEVRALPVAAARAALTREDEVAAARLAPSDTTRVARALEVVRSTGRPLAAWQAERALAPAEAGGIAGEVDLVPLIILPPRAWLFERIDRRFAAMVEAGALDEVAALLGRGLDPALPVMRAIGVREIAAFLSGAIDFPALLERVRAATRKYGKRQYTWFSRQPPSAWQRCTTTPEISDLVIMLRQQLLTR